MAKILAFNLNDHLGDAQKIEVIGANAEYFKLKDSTYALKSVVKSLIAKNLIEVDGNFLVLKDKVKVNTKDGITYMSEIRPISMPNF